MKYLLTFVNSKAARERRDDVGTVERVMDASMRRRYGKEPDAAKINL